MSVFDDSLTGGLAAIRSLAGGPITYHAGSATIPIALAVEGSTAYDSEDSEGVKVTARSVDFLLPVADLVVGDQAVEPTAGHWIEKGAKKFEVLPLGQEPCYRYSDPNRSEYRVHTKEIV